MRNIDELFETEFKIFGLTITIFDLFFFTVLTCLGIIMRMSLYDIVSGDYKLAFADWMRECHEAGGFHYLGIKPGVSDASTFDYNCMFQYVIVILHYIGGGISDMYLVKTVSVIFDFVCAITIFRIAYAVTEGDVKKSMIAYAATMFLPTMVLNSGAWAQNDSIYTTFVFLSLLSIIKRKDNRAFIYLALAYSFKQQAIFFVPFVILMWLKNKVKIRYIFWIPVIHVLAMVPAAIAGRSWGDLLGIYGKQVTMFSRLTMNYPSIYAIIANDLNSNIRKILIPVGSVATVMIFGIIAYYIYKKKFEITGRYMITLVIFTSLLCCFCLPAMHERYAYIPEVLAVVYAVFSYKRMSICTALQVIAMITYSRYLFGSTVTTVWPLSIAMLITIMVVGYDLFLQMKENEIKAESVVDEQTETETEAVSG
ncbi:hypothetical protein D6853_13545 [Butyrivibrio sp. X503]|uniref:hypothetical protein n=1 Tax=Butyrivibrio sp. X503 TaxID=2364878 RepID=UPI000EA9E244|nr:hypothetical protein [Butyrivibrio sp. X503]RKM54250.1 hypothetical protein D6853_13545 [Butyrivibrio sp. X503]